MLIGHDEVASFYRTTCETGKNVIGALPMYMRVDDFGVVTEARWAEVLTGILARNEHGHRSRPQRPLPAHAQHLPDFQLYTRCKTRR